MIRLKCSRCIDIGVKEALKLGIKLILIIDVSTTCRIDYYSKLINYCFGYPR